MAKMLTEYCKRFAVTSDERGYGKTHVDIKVYYNKDVFGKDISGRLSRGFVFMVTPVEVTNISESISSDCCGFNCMACKGERNSKRMFEDAKQFLFDNEESALNLIYEKYRILCDRLNYTEYTN